MGVVFLTKQPLSLIIKDNHSLLWKQTMSYNSWLQCIRGCDQRYSIYDVVYRCEQCGGLLDVEHDIEALKTRSAAAWIKLFDQRSHTNEWPYGSGVWG